MADMQPRETAYDGNLHRSLLEARWAVFFDNAGIPYEYEYNGYKLGQLGKTWYLPDFWLPEQKTWVEVKPRSDVVGTDLKKITHFEKALQNEPKRSQFYVFVGSPYVNGRRH